MTKEIGDTSLDQSWMDDFFSSFSISPPKPNDTCRPHPKFISNSHKRCSAPAMQDEVKRLQNKRRADLLDNLKRFVYSIQCSSADLFHFSENAKN